MVTLHASGNPKPRPPVQATETNTAIENIDNAVDAHDTALATLGTNVAAATLPAVVIANVTTPTYAVSMASNPNLSAFLTLSANTALTVSNVPASGQLVTVTLFLTQDSVGNRTITWPSTFRWVGTASPTTGPTLATAAGGTNIIRLSSFDGGASWIAEYDGQTSGVTTPVQTTLFAPTGLVARPGAATGTITVEFTSPNVTATARVVQYRTSATSSTVAGAWQTFATSGTPTSVTITGLTGGTYYDVQVADQASSTTGPFSATFTSTPATLIAETWAGTTGGAWPSAWAMTTPSATSATVQGSLNNRFGQMVNAPTAGAQGPSAWRTTMTAGKNLTVSVTNVSLSGDATIYIGGSTDGTPTASGPSTGYYMQLTQSHGWAVYRAVSGVDTQLGATQPFNLQPGQQVNVLFSVQSGLVRAWVWSVGSQMPATPGVTATDTLVTGAMKAYLATSNGQVAVANSVQFGPVSISADAAATTVTNTAVVNAYQFSYAGGSTSYDLTVTSPADNNTLVVVGKSGQDVKPDTVAGGRVSWTIVPGYRLDTTNDHYYLWSFTGAGATGGASTTITVTFPSAPSFGGFFQVYELSGLPSDAAPSFVARDSNATGAAAQYPSITASVSSGSIQFAAAIVETLSGNPPTAAPAGWTRPASGSGAATIDGAYVVKPSGLSVTPQYTLGTATDQWDIGVLIFGSTSATGGGGTGGGGGTSGGSTGTTPVGNPDGLTYTLAASDDFTTLDSSKWWRNRYNDTNNFDWDFNPSQEASLIDNTLCYVSNGTVHMDVAAATSASIAASGQYGSQFTYRTGMIRGADNGPFSFSNNVMIEASIKFNSSAGNCWPGFWALPTGAWPPELDMLEIGNVGASGVPTGNYHPIAGGNYYYVNWTGVTDVRDAFHTFAWRIYNGQLTYYFDGRVVWDHPIPDNAFSSGAYSWYPILGLGVNKGGTAGIGTGIELDWIKKWTVSASGGGGGGGGGGSTSSGDGVGYTDSNRPAMPTDTLVTGATTFSDDFLTNVSLGGWSASSYATSGKWASYENFGDTDGNAIYNSNQSISVANSILDQKGFTTGGTTYFSNIQPDTGSNYFGFTTGRYRMLMKATETGGVGFKIAYLLWPMNNQWQNEVDFPENMDMNGQIRGVAELYDASGNGSYGFTGSVDLGVNFKDGLWHLFEYRGYSNRMEFYIDNVLKQTIRNTDTNPSAVPAQPMRLTLQAETYGKPPSGCVAHVMVDWVVVEKWT